MAASPIGPDRLALALMGGETNIPWPAVRYCEVPHTGGSALFEVLGGPWETGIGSYARLG